MMAWAAFVAAHATALKRERRKQMLFSAFREKRKKTKTYNFDVLYCINCMNCSSFAVSFSEQQLHCVFIHLFFFIANRYGFVSFLLRSFVRWLFVMIQTDLILVNFLYWVFCVFLLLTYARAHTHNQHSCADSFYSLNMYNLTF